MLCSYASLTRRPNNPSRPQRTPPRNSSNLSSKLTHLSLLTSEQAMKLSGVVHRTTPSLRAHTRGRFWRTQNTFDETRGRARASGGTNKVVQRRMRFRLQQGETTLGRAHVYSLVQSGSLVVPGDRQKLLNDVSRSHASICLAVNGTVTIRSLGLNPTGVRAPGSGWEWLRRDAERALVHGMEICFHKRPGWDKLSTLVLCCRRPPQADALEYELAPPSTATVLLATATPVTAPSSAAPSPAEPSPATSAKRGRQLDDSAADDDSAKQPRVSIGEPKQVEPLRSQVIESPASQSALYSNAGVDFKCFQGSIRFTWVKLGICGYRFRLPPDALPWRRVAASFLCACSSTSVATSQKASP